MDTNPAEFLLNAIASGGVAVVFLSILWKAWISNKFSERLEKMRHDQTQELQRLGVEIDSLSSGAIRLQDRDFEVLPGVWKHLDESYQQVQWVFPIVHKVQPVDKMTEGQLNELLDKTQLTETQKDEVRTSEGEERVKIYGDLSLAYRLHDTKRTIGDLEQYISRNGIFMEPKLKENLLRITDILKLAVISKEHRDKDNYGHEKIKEAKPFYNEIESYIQKRLQSHGSKPLCKTGKSED